MQPREKSFIFGWGVRVTFSKQGKEKIGFVCLADEACRTDPDGNNLVILSMGKTTAAVKHLRIVHGLASPKTVKETETKRKRDEEIEHLRSSGLYKNNPTRLNLLLETLRIINHNLPLCMGEYEESRLQEALVVKDVMRVTITTERIEESIIELYSSTRNEKMELIEINRKPYPAFTMVADFWTCKTNKEKYLGLRVYMVDRNWEFKSVLLGTRKFTPAYGDRDGGIRAPFLIWIKRTLEDFNLTTRDFYGATTDAGPEVKALMIEELHLKWMWCTAHMVNAATKSGCGMNNNQKHENDEFASLMAKVVRTISQVQSVETTGDLFKQLCKAVTSTGATKLKQYSAARFLSLAKTLRRILDKWAALEAWYDERKKKAIRDKKPPVVFPLAGEKTTLIHLQSIVQPLADLIRSCQAESAVQVNVLMRLYGVRMNTLNSEQPLRHYLSTDLKPVWIDPSELTPLAALTRNLLCKALDKRFFRRYYDACEMDNTAFISEMQLKLHPIWKRPKWNINKLVVLVCRQQGLDSQQSFDKLNEVNNIVRDQLQDLLETVAEPTDMPCPPPSASSAYFDPLEAMFASPPTQQAPIGHATSQMQRRINEELDRWKNDQLTVERADGVPESVLSFWARVEHNCTYRLLPKAANILFAVPSSSCQIERDFSVSGSMVTSQRTSLSAHNIDMCSVLNRNREYVDLLQCEKIPSGEHRKHTPSCFTFPLDVDIDLDVYAADALSYFVSSASLYDDEEEKDNVI